MFVVKSFQILKTTLCHEAVEEVSLSSVSFCLRFPGQAHCAPSSVTYRNQRSLSLGLGVVKFTHEVADLRNTSPS